MTDQQTPLADDGSPRQLGDAPPASAKDRIKGPTFDIMSDAEIEDANQRIMGMIGDTPEAESSIKGETAS